LASQVLSYGYIVPTLRAGNGRVYSGIYRRVGQKLESHLTDAIFEVPDLKMKLESLGEPFTCLGGGVERLEVTSKNSNYKVLEDQTPMAVHVGQLALGMGDQEAKDISEVKLNYLMSPV